jgi:hypothetical protein
MFARRSRSSEADLRLFKTTKGWPRAFKYIIFSGVSLVNLGSEGVRKNGIKRTELLLAIFLEHPELVLEL